MTEGPRRPAGAAVLVVMASISQEVGAAFAVGLFATLGTLGAVFTRFAVAGVILCAAVRPRLRGVSGRAWLSALALATTLVVMNFSFYCAIARIPLGIAVTIEVLGPLILSVAASTRRVAWLWAVLAFAGVAMLGLTRHDDGRLDAAGFGFAAVAGASWAGYILASSRTAAQFRRIDGLALATGLGALALTPFALLLVDFAGALRFDVIVLAVSVSVLSSLVPYSLELLSLRHLHPSVFAVLTSLSPVVAALAGLMVLGQQIGTLGYLGVALVTAASIGAVRTAHTGPAEPLA
ncbi:EamA family transporter [Mycolicibacterium smegmatis]|uniref:Integral membrane protein n=1 Tax=Mycolicibacterium smegmatis (strain MKD8) TaxID=1214915 RepID=A0A2U9PL98_MYCSE|nr:EamA family transporter [Mycolicibacterium smegmatis]AWT52507.1 integral membrane protein [Mycolicibacterium smegmatis MKD8]MCP2627215.1 EamA family transporter [Mycolicibacterium smegmatis]UGU30835.1 EamA family transporter [Mycolicibacterium smegmatis]ULN71747.1 EamA family transporter [Mycolicibacterium smegmatis]